MLRGYVNRVPQKGSTRFGEVSGAQGVRRQGFLGGVRGGSIDGFGVSFWRVCGGSLEEGFGRRLDMVLEGGWRRGYSYRIGGWFCGGLLLSLHNLYLVGSVSWCEGSLVGSLLDCMRHEGLREVIRKSARRDRVGRT